MIEMDLHKKLTEKLYLPPDKKQTNKLGGQGKRGRGRGGKEEVITTHRLDLNI